MEIKKDKKKEGRNAGSERKEMERMTRGGERRGRGEG